ncbi:MAG: DUF1786 domain-containing protein [Chloroflexota bacterium]|nr:DUF1786 domain-containing protein [Chloroflexota bacterium]
MRILAVDIGTGTQDILLADSSGPLENATQLILPSPTLAVAGRIRAATAARQAVLLTGTIMGGGPCAWAAEDHLRAGLAVYAAPDAARTFDDDPARVTALGVQIVEPSTAVAGAVTIPLRDFDPAAILAVVAEFGGDPTVDALALAVFDHGDAPPGVSDRRFRFDYLAERLAAGGQTDLTAFAFMRAAIPVGMTRLAAAAHAPTGVLADLPILAMDTGPAAILGTLEDPTVRAAANSDSGALICNVGNFHTLAFLIVAGRVTGLFEHHTGELTDAQLAALLTRLAAGTLTNGEVFDHKGHGALLLDPTPRRPRLCAVTGPRRAKLATVPLPAPLHQAVPHGAMMLTGCFALLRALAVHWPPAQEPVAALLAGAG